MIRIFLMILLGFVLVGPLLGNLVTYKLYDGDLFKEMTSDSPDPEIRTALLAMQAIVSFIGLIFIPIIYIAFVEHKSLKNFFPANLNLSVMLGIVAVIGLAFPIAISPLAEWNMNLHFPEFLGGFDAWARGQEDTLAKVTQIMTDTTTTAGYITLLVIIAVIPAIGEELVFRGLIQQEFWRSSRNIHLAIWLSAFIFSAIHMQFYGFIPRVLLGALFGYLYYWSGNLLVPIFSHFVNNAFGVTMLYLGNIKATSIDVEGGEAAPWPYVIGCLLLTVFLLYYAMNYFRKTRGDQSSANFNES